MKHADQTLQVLATIEGDPRRPRRIALEPIPGGGPLPTMTDGKYMPVNGSLVPFEPQKRPEDGSKLLKISAEAYDRLRSLRQRGDSATVAMERLIYEATEGKQHPKS